MSATSLHPEVTDEVLTEFVTQSNAIEGYPIAAYGPGTQLFDQHLAAARHVADKEIWYPKDIHFRVMHGLMDDPMYVGAYRCHDVYIGGRAAVSPGYHLDVHMERWFALASLGPKDGEDVEAWCWKMHDLFECIHPFMDGNGRTGRLLLNGLRLRHGMSWKIVHEGDEQKKYYRHIQRYRDEEFDCHEFRNKFYYKSRGKNADT